MTEELEIDPMAPISFEPNEDDGYYVEYIPPIEEPEAAVAVEKPVVLLQVDLIPETAQESLPTATDH